MNGCYNREPLKETIVAQDGRYAHQIFAEGKFQYSTMPRMVELPAPLSKTCQYSLTTKDAKCAGCRWNQQESEAAEEAAYYEELERGYARDRK